MTTFVLAFVSLALVLGIYAFVGLPFGSRKRRAAVSAFFAAVLAGLFFGYSDMLGRPKSTRLEVLRAADAEAKVIGSYLVEGSGIYLWLQLPGVGEPRYYVLPWDEKTATALQKAIEENATQHGAGIVMQLPVRALLGQARAGVPSAAAAEAAGEGRHAAPHHLRRAGAASVTSGFARRYRWRA